MKVDLPVTPTWEIKGGWEGQMDLFPFYSFAVNLPMPIFIVTTLKENGLSNAQLNAWGMMVGSGKEPKFVMMVHNYSDTIKLIEKNKEFVINIPSLEIESQMKNTTKHYDIDTDEIIASGLTIEKSKVVKTPRIKECFAHYECVVDWTKDIEDEEKVSTLVMGKILNTSIDEDYARDNVKASFEKRNLPYFVNEFYNHENKTITEDGWFTTIKTDRLEAKENE